MIKKKIVLTLHRSLPDTRRGGRAVVVARLGAAVPRDVRRLPDPPGRHPCLQL